MNRNVRIYFPETPQDNLAEQVDPQGFFANARIPIPPLTDEDIFREDITNHLVSEGIVPDERRGDLVFDFE